MQLGHRGEDLLLHREEMAGVQRHGLRQRGYSEVAHSLCSVLQPCPSLQLMNVTGGEGGGRGWREMEQKHKAAISDIVCLSPDRLTQRRRHGSTHRTAGSSGAEGEEGTW